MIIRICTENKNHERVRELCAKRFDAFTIFHGMGAWKGKLEPSMTIEIAELGNHWKTRDYGRHNVVELAKDIKTLNGQEAVLIEYIESTNVLI
jgi:hypothetical protein